MEGHVQLQEHNDQAWVKILVLRKLVPCLQLPISHINNHGYSILSMATMQPMTHPMTPPKSPQQAVS